MLGRADLMMISLYCYLLNQDWVKLVFLYDLKENYDRFGDFVKDKKNSSCNY